MAKLKKSEAFTAEREREIQQASDLFHFIFFYIKANLTISSLLTKRIIPLTISDLQVVESVNELAQIMKDLSVLVIDQVRSCIQLSSCAKTFCFMSPLLILLISKQGTIVDRIDYNIQNVATTVEEGLKQLQKVPFLSSLVIFFQDLLSLSLSLAYVSYSDVSLNELGTAG